jgi:hypothetical protein
MRLPTHVMEIQSARKRCVSMGKHHAWMVDFDRHPLAATMDNYTVCIDVELCEESPDFLAVLIWILTMARKINAYCDAERVSGNAAAEYWLERFLWRSDKVCQWNW